MGWPNNPWTQYLISEGLSQKGEKHLLSMQSQFNKRKCPSNQVIFKYLLIFSFFLLTNFICRDFIMLLILVFQSEFPGENGAENVSALWNCVQLVNSCFRQAKLCYKVIFWIPPIISSVIQHNFFMSTFFQTKSTCLSIVCYQRSQPNLNPFKQIKLL